MSERTRPSDERIHMRVLHVINTLDPLEGGPPQVAMRLAAAQAALGASVSILHHRPTPERERVIAAALGHVPGHASVEVETVEPPDVSPLSGRLRGQPPKSLLEADFVHVHCVWTPLLRAVARIRRSAGRPYGVQPHGMLDPWSLAQKRWKKRIALALGYRAMLQGAAFIHALNRDEAELLGPLRLAPPIEVVGNGIFPEEFRSAGSAAGRRYSLFLARLHFKKGLDVLAEAWRRVAVERPDTDLVVAGPDEGAEEDFRRRIRDAGLESRTRVVGPLYGSEKLAALRGAACFVLPSRQEGFSVALLEALACGVPVVASEDCHFPEIAEERCGAVVPLDAARFAEAWSAVLARPDEAKAMGERGRRMVLERFTWPAVAARTLELYARYGAARS